jgi:hypothetical protein
LLNFFRLLGSALVVALLGAIVLGGIGGGAGISLEVLAKSAAKKKAAEDRAMKKQKEDACKKQADEQKLRLLKRRSFIKDCVAKG